MSGNRTSSASLFSKVVNLLNSGPWNDGPDCSEYEPEYERWDSSRLDAKVSNLMNGLQEDPSAPQADRSEPVLTENGALSYDSTTDPRLDLFFKTVRGMTSEYLFQLLEKSWEVSPRDTLRTMFYVRDCRGGKGERKIFWYFMNWLNQKDPSFFEKNIPCVPFYGSFKDLRRMYELNSELEQSLISFWCTVINKDIVSLNHGMDQSLTLAAKWVPIQDSRFCKEMGLTHKYFRKSIRLLREKLDIVECKMSAGQWEQIYFERVCSLSMKKYSKAFSKHCQERFAGYLESVQKGEKKMNVGQLYPSDIAKEFLKSDSSCDESTLNVAWEQLLIKTRTSLSANPKRFLCVVDTSGSMSGEPLNVAVSLGLFLSELVPESSFYRKFITFSQTPQLQEATGETLKDRINSLSRAAWEMNTDLQQVFDLVLSNSTKQDHPDVIIILSDMQFDEATRARAKSWGEDDIPVSATNLEQIEGRYRESGIPRPRLIFWNLRPNTIDFPATSAISNCGLVSGYSTSIIDSLLQEGDISPMSIYRKTIDSPRYDMVITE
jgi:hypothetical protein